jgi:hypothetical protein
MTDRQGSLFFTADVLIAVLVIVGAFMMIQTSYAEPSQGEDPQQALLQLNNFFRETTVEDINRDYPGVYTPPNYDGQADPWRAELTLYQELLYLLHETNQSFASTYLENVTSVVEPGTRFTVRYSVDGTPIYQRGTSSINESPAYVTKRLIVYSVVDDGQTIIGPNRTAIAVWL